MTSRQLNIRLDPEDRDRLEALAFVRRTHASTLARAIVLEYLSRYANEPGLSDAVAALGIRDAAELQQGSVHRLDVAWRLLAGRAEPEEQDDANPPPVPHSADPRAERRTDQ